MNKKSDRLEQAIPLVPIGQGRPPTEDELDTLAETLQDFIPSKIDLSNLLNEMRMDKCDVNRQFKELLGRVLTYAAYGN